jgi:hypothetical protein
MKPPAVTQALADTGTPPIPKAKGWRRFGLANAPEERLSQLPQRPALLQPPART